MQPKIYRQYLRPPFLPGSMCLLIPLFCCSFFLGRVSGLLILQLPHYLSSNSLHCFLPPMPSLQGRFSHLFLKASALPLPFISTGPLYISLDLSFAVTDLDILWYYDSFYSFLLWIVNHSFSLVSLWKGCLMT